MGAVGRILLIIVVIAVVAAGAAFFVLPNQATRTETINVDRPAATVFARLASTPAGATIAEGVTLTGITSAENNVVQGDVTFADGGTGDVTYTVAEAGEGSSVQVALAKDLGTNPINRFGAITGAGVGPLVEAAASSVTADLTALPAATFSGLQYDVVEMAAQPFFYIQNCSASDPESITSIITQATQAIPPIMRANSMTVTGPLMAVEPRVVENQYCFQVGYPYRGRQPRTLLTGQAGQAPSGTMLHVHYTGSETDVMDQVYNPMDALLGAARLDDPSTADDDWTTFEVYNDDPTQEGGSRNREIYYVSTGDISSLNAIHPATTAAAAPAEAPAAPATPAPATPAPATP